MLHTQGSFQPGPGDGKRREPGGRENSKAEALGLLLAETATLKMAPEKESPEEVKREQKNLPFSFLKSGNCLLYLQRRNLPQREKKKAESTCPPPQLC